MRLVVCVSIIVFLLVNKGFGQSDYLSGLYFYSTEVVQDQRTSLDLTPQKPLKLSSSFKIDFDIKFREGDGYYGYIFRIISNGIDNFDLISNFASVSDNFSLVFKDEILCTYKWSELPDVEYEKWTHVSFNLDMENQQVEISIDGISKTSALIYPHVKADFNFLFGVSKYAPFQSTDVCPMSLKNIQIENDQKQTMRKWNLAKHQNNIVLDEIHQATANVENPGWLINKHLTWEKALDLKLNQFLGAVQDEKSNKLYLADDQKILQYDQVKSSIDTFEYFGGNPYRQLAEKHLIFNPYTNEIWSYNFGDEEIIRFNLDKRQWSSSAGQRSESGYAHHNKLISPVDSSLISLFGYGFYKYKSTVFNYHPSIKKWNQFDMSDQIAPRYLAATGLLNDEELLIFGGYGSKTGRQELSPGYYHDLYVFNLKNYEFEKQLSYDFLKSPFVPCESLILNEDSSSFYTLVFDNSKFKTSIRLAKFGITEPTQSFYEDSIQFDFLDTDSWLNLYLSKPTKQLFALTNHNSDISLYSIAYPPLNPEDVYQKTTKSKWGNYLLLILIIIASVFVVVFLYFLKRRKRLADYPKRNIESGTINDQAFQEVPRKQELSILFLGGFQIFNDSGLEITSEFSPMLKQLFLIIFFNTIHNSKGISSLKLEEALWFDKTEKSARNNRNVNISKLRTVIDEMEKMEVVTQNSYWKLKIDKSVYCDYLEVVSIITKSKDSILSREEINELINLLDFGELLPNIQVEWLDSFKAQYTNDVIDCLIRLISRNDLEQDSELLLHICDNIFSLDSINENALIVKCRILHKTGKGSIAHNFYYSFCKEYKRLLNTDFDILFPEILEDTSS